LPFASPSFPFLKVDWRQSLSNFLIFNELGEMGDYAITFRGGNEAD
jgi:hypothetical protein